MNESNATNLPTISSINFHDDVIYTLERDGQPFTPVRPIIENIGLDWSAQYRKLQDGYKRWGCCSIATTLKGQRKEYLCMPVRKLPGFLATIQANRVKKELQEKLIRYQDECDDVLWDYWTKGKAINPRQRAEYHEPSRTLTQQQLAKLDQELLDKMKCWNPENHEKGRKAFHHNIKNQFNVSKVEDIPQDSFDEILQFIQNKYNHPVRLGISQDIVNHCPNVIDDFLQFMLYRVNAILEDMAGVSNSVARHNVTIELTMITSALGAVFPEEMQWLRLGWLRDMKQIEYKSDPEVAPKVKAYDQFLDSDGVYTLTSAFKALGLKPNLHIKRMRENDKVLYYQNGNNVPYQKCLDQGLFVVKMNHNERTNKDYPQTYVTPKGLDWLREKYCMAVEEFAGI